MAISLLKFGQRPAISKIDIAHAAHYFSPDYFTARERFVTACRSGGFKHHVLAVDAPGPTGEPLTIDIAARGIENSSSALVLSSGVHGVEGLFGSAVQLALLDCQSAAIRLPERTALVLIHAINPYGFAWRRRFNEQNIDLNRNFLLPSEEYAGAPPLCNLFRATLLTRAFSSRIAASRSRLAMMALRHGSRACWETLPVGQYEFADWLFFGGKSRAASARLLDEFLPRLIDPCQEIVHLDFHTGLGSWADCKLLLPERDSQANIDWWQRRFGLSAVPPPESRESTYHIRGGWGTWLQASFGHSRYRFATAEFGTYSPMKVLGALIDELAVYLKTEQVSPEHRVRRRLQDAFVPRSPSWRAKTLTQALAFVRRAAGQFEDRMESKDS